MDDMKALIARVLFIAETICQACEWHQKSRRLIRKVLIHAFAIQDLERERELEEFFTKLNVQENKRRWRYGEKELQGWRHGDEEPAVAPGLEEFEAKRELLRAKLQSSMSELEKFTNDEDECFLFKRASETLRESASEKEKQHAHVG